MKTINKKNLEKFFSAKDKGDFDMVFLTDKYLSDYIGPEAGRLFRENPMIIDVNNSASAVQRVIINRYLTNVLLRFRSIKDIPIHDTLAMIVSDGCAEDWFTLLREIVIPFFKKNNVFGVAYS